MAELQFPPPHMLFHEVMDDREMIRIWKEYTARHAADLDVCEVDAAEVCSVDEFGRLFEIWVTSKSSKRVKLLMVWHAHFLSLACQQALRRWLETKSYRARVWFHAEYVNNIQPAIQSRCILKHIRGDIVDEISAVHEGDTAEMISLWKRIVSQESYEALR